MADLKASSTYPPASDHNPSDHNPSPDVEKQADSPSVADCPDVEKQADSTSVADGQHKKDSAFKSLSILDRFLALWIFLAMLIGILLGNFVDDVGPALQKGKFVGVSVPIGMPRPPTSKQPR